MHPSPLDDKTKQLEKKYDDATDTTGFPEIDNNRRHRILDGYTRRLGQTHLP